MLVAACAGCARGAVELAPDSSLAADASRLADSRADDAPLPVGCMISEGSRPLLDGVNDLAKYPAAQRVALGAMLGSDGAALTWDRDRLYLTASSSAFVAAYEPLHLYLEAAQSVAAPVAAPGKEYSGLTAVLPFTATHLIAIRRISDAGSGAYDGVYVPAGGWTTRETTLAPGVDVLASSDQRTLSASIPWAALGGCPSQLRLAMHVVHGIAGNEWKDLAPSTHGPWLATGGGYYEIDLTGAPAVTGWALR